MRDLIRTLLIGGVAALLITPTGARAGDFREGERGEWQEQREHGREQREHAHEWREERQHAREWREQRERRALDHRWHELAEARERFYATWQGNPWRRARFERWYTHRREELREWGERCE